MHRNSWSSLPGSKKANPTEEEVLAFGIKTEETKERGKCLNKDFLKRWGSLVSLVIVFIFAAVYFVATDEDSKRTESFGTPIVGTLFRTPEPAPTSASDQAPTQPEVQATAQPAVTAEQPTKVMAGDRINVPSVGISSYLSYKSVSYNSADNSLVLPNPSNPDEVVIYDFSVEPYYGGKPGKGGNIVLSGHVDWGRQNRIGCNNSVNVAPAPCLGIFYPLKDLKQDAIIELSFGGETFRYQVKTRFNITPGDDWRPILSATEKETVTLITCDGEFDARTSEYLNRLVIQAVRVS